MHFCVWVFGIYEIVYKSNFCGHHSFGAQALVIGFRSLAFSCCVSAVLFGFYESIVLGVSGLDDFDILINLLVGHVPGCSIVVIPFCASRLL